MENIGIRSSKIPAGGRSVVFSNLKTLPFSFLDHSDFDYRCEETRYNFPECLAPAQDVQPQFPQLTNLTLNNGYKQRALQFNPQVISSSLEKVFSKVRLEDLVLFCKPPSHSIGNLKLISSLYGVEEMEAFYRSTNRLLGEIGNLRNYMLFVLGGGFDLVDIERINWLNVTELRLRSIDSSALMELLARLPLLRSTWLDPFIYTSSYNSFGQGDSQLKEVEIVLLERDEWTLDDVAEFLCRLTKQHPNIDKLALPKDLKNRIKGTFKGTQWQHIELVKTTDWSFLFGGKESDSEDEDL